jgi:hypothetical protein
MEQADVWQFCIVKFLIAEGVSSFEIHWWLSSVIKEMSPNGMSEQFAHFWEDQKSSLDNAGTGVICIVITDANIYCDCWDLYPVTTEVLEEIGFKVFQCSFYSPCLVPSDFPFFWATILEFSVYEPVSV